jgi:uncharacterized damage-inducible protein DinB
MSTVERLLIDDCIFRLRDESHLRILKCLNQLTDDEIWRRPNSNLVSAGNLVLHLRGNVRQWIISTLGGEPDLRVRQDEFDEVGPIPRSDLIEKLESTIHEACAVMDGLTAEALTAAYKVQDFDETGVSILVHVTEHFSYHTGQIAWATKLMKNIDLDYYPDRDLSKTQ